MTLLDSTCQIALAALTESLGEFARRADAAAPSAPEDLFQFLNCPQPGSAPDAFARAVIAKASSIASGSAEAAKPGNARTLRLKTLFEQVRVEGESWASGRSHYPLEALSAGSIFPKKGNGTAADVPSAAEYRKLWDGFTEGLEKIPSSHAEKWPLWLDHFDTLWMTFTQALPEEPPASGSDPDVPLYDHGKVSAALAAALWRWHREKGLETEAAIEALKNGTDDGERKLLFIQGDFTGIQDFIFTSGANTNRQAAKILRGRSFYVSLLSELAALRVLTALELPSTSQITNAAGKFLIAAPNTDQTAEKLARVRQEIADWFLRNTLGTSNLALISIPGSCADLRTGRPFSQFMKRLFTSLERAKLQQLGLLRADAPAVLDADYSSGVCDWNIHLPADREESGKKSCALSRDQIRIGEMLTKKSSLLVLSESDPLPSGVTSLELPIFGCRVCFTDDEEIEKKFSGSAGNGSLLRCWDFTMPESPDQVLWHGYARRYINGFIPRFSEKDSNLRYYDGKALDPLESGDIKTFGHIACENRIETPNRDVLGIAALGVLKGDIDNLGLIFQKGLAGPMGNSMSFVRMAGLSRQINAFFTIYLPSLCAREFPSMYTVFAGGDDFFLIGPWLTAQRFAGRIRREFSRYTAENPALHFSAGIATVKAGVPVRTLSEFAESALEAAKKTEGKNAVCVFGSAVPWIVWEKLEVIREDLEKIRDDYGWSTGFLYSLFELIGKAEKESTSPEAAMWRSQLSYKTARWAELRFRGDENARRNARDRVLRAIYKPLSEMKGQFRIPLTNIFYSVRR